MAGISFSSSGSFKNTFAFLNRMRTTNLIAEVEPYAQEGVAALSSMTPKLTGLTASSWGYEISQYGDGVRITWYNTDEEGGVNVAVILQYGHGTGTGGYVQGIDYINPAMQPIFARIAENVWRKVISA